MNILPGKVEGPGRVSVGGQTIVVADMRDGLSPGSTVEVGLRPEDVQAGGAPGASSLGMDVDFVEELGATQLFHGKVAGTDFVVQASTGQIPAETRKLTLSIDPANVHLFDPQTTKRLGRA
jgi:sn-glycerol 3-phosphate transport system ATP-binding protein